MIIQIELEKVLWKFIKEYSYMFNDNFIQDYIKKNREKYVQSPAHVLGDYIFEDAERAQKIRDYLASWMLDYFERQENFSNLLERLDRDKKLNSDDDFIILPDDTFLDEED